MGVDTTGRPGLRVISSAIIPPVAATVGSIKGPGIGPGYIG